MLTEPVSKLLVPEPIKKSPLPPDRRSELWSAVNICIVPELPAVEAPLEIETEPPDKSLDPALIAILLPSWCLLVPTERLIAPLDPRAALPEFICTPPLAMLSEVELELILILPVLVAFSVRILMFPLWSSAFPEEMERSPPGLFD
jgi:hypothetical protein